MDLLQDASKKKWIKIISMYLQTAHRWLFNDDHEFSWFQAYAPMGSPGGTSGKSRQLLKDPVLNMIAEKLGKSPAQVALRWGLQMGHSVLPKSTNEGRLKENFDVFDWSIPEDLFAKFSEIEQASSLS